MVGQQFSSSEYIVASYGLANLDFSLGFGWGALDRNNDFSNRLIEIDDNFRNRGKSSNTLIDTDSDHFFLVKQHLFLEALIMQLITAFY